MTPPPSSIEVPQPPSVAVFGPVAAPEHLVQIVDRALADAVERAGSWLACRPGCSACCHGVFAISSLDAERLRAGLEALQAAEPLRASAVRTRAAASVARLRDGFPGDPVTGELSTSPAAVAIFEEFADDEPCPALDPVGQTCDLYSARPILCRTFGPPLKYADNGLAVCELCFDGAPPEEVERCQIGPAVLNAQQVAESLFLAGAGAEEAPRRAETIVAYALQG